MNSNDRKYIKEIEDDNERMRSQIAVYTIKYEKLSDDYSKVTSRLKEAEARIYQLEKEFRRSGERHHGVSNDYYQTHPSYQEEINRRIYEEKVMREVPRKLVIDEDWFK